MGPGPVRPWFGPVDPRPDIKPQFFKISPKNHIFFNIILYLISNSDSDPSHIWFWFQFRNQETGSTFSLMVPVPSPPWIRIGTDPFTTLHFSISKCCDCYQALSVYAIPLIGNKTFHKCGLHMKYVITYIATNMYSYIKSICKSNEPAKLKLTWAAL